MVRLQYAISGHVLAASAGLAVAQSPSIVAPKAPMTAAGLPLPLRGEETLEKFSNGCLAVIPKPRPAGSVYGYSKIKWQGACRFGLADGKGFNDYSSIGRSFHQLQYRLGILQPGAYVMHDGYGGKWIVRSFEHFAAYNRPEQINISNWSLPADAGDQYRYLMIRHSQEPDVWSRYFQGQLVCPYPKGSTIPADKLQPFSEADQNAVKQYCRTREIETLYYIEYKRVEEPGFGLKFPDGKDQHILTVRHYLCRSQNDCREAWNAATAAEWPEIERLKVELAAAHKAFMADWEARFAPLEAAFQAKLKRLSQPATPKSSR